MLTKSWLDCPQRRTARQISALCIDDACMFGDIQIRRNSNTGYTLSCPGVYERFVVRQGDVSKLVRRVMDLMDKPRMFQMALFKDIA